MLRLCISGNPRELHPFMYDLQSQPQYCVKWDNQEPGSDTSEVKVHAWVSFQPPHRRPIHVRLETAEGSPIDIHFLDGQAIRLDHGVWFVCGKVFDLFG